MSSHFISSQRKQFGHITPLCWLGSCSFPSEFATNIVISPFTKEKENEINRFFGKTDFLRPREWVFLGSCSLPGPMWTVGERNRLSSSEGEVDITSSIGKKLIGYVGREIDR